MRLNLPNYHCVQLRLTSEFSIPKGKEAEIDAFIELTHSHGSRLGEEGETRAAHFGSRSRTRGIIHQVQGRLDKTTNPTDLNISIIVSSTQVSDQLRPPPKAFKSVASLVERATALFGPVEISCRAVFNYDPESEYESIVSLPMPLMLKGGQSGVTHMESIQFSRRLADEVEYRIIVATDEESNLTVHSVDFVSTSEWSLKSVREIFNGARDISQQFVVRKGES